MESKQIFQETTEGYTTRINNRMGTFAESTMELFKKLLLDGKTEDEAKGILKALNNEVCTSNPDCIVKYWCGNCQPLIDAVNGSAITEMTAENKALVVGILSIE